ncbi:hypothetical protein HPB47_007673, partial [Ixodes persulcatus]
ATYSVAPAVTGLSTLHTAPAVNTVAHAPAFGYGYGVGHLGYGLGHFGYGHGLPSYGLNYGYGLGSYADYTALLRKKKWETGRLQSGYLIIKLLCIECGHDFLREDPKKREAMASFTVFE